MPPPQKQKRSSNNSCKFNNYNESTFKRMRVTAAAVADKKILNYHHLHHNHHHLAASSSPIINSDSISNMFIFNSSRNDAGSDFSIRKGRSFFKQYTNNHENDYIGPEGIERLCHDLGIKPEDPVVLVLSWKLNAKVMGFYTYDEWQYGMSDLKCDSIVKLKNKLDHLRRCLDDPAQFRLIYRYSFEFSKENNQRNINIETAKQLLILLLGPRWNLLNYFIEFLNQSHYQVINKDQYYNILDFSLLVDYDLSNYDENGAWPVMLDEFVEWCRLKKMSASIISSVSHQ